MMQNLTKHRGKQMSENKNDKLAVVKENRGGKREGAGRPLGALQKTPSVKQLSKEFALQHIQERVSEASPLLTQTLMAESLGVYVVLKKSVVKGSEWELIKTDEGILDALNVLTNEEGLLKPFSEKDGYFFTIQKDKPNMKALELAMNYTFGKPQQNINLDGEKSPDERAAEILIRNYLNVMKEKTWNQLNATEKISFYKAFGEAIITKIVLPRLEDGSYITT